MCREDPRSEPSWQRTQARYYRDRPTNDEVAKDDDRSKNQKEERQQAATRSPTLKTLHLPHDPGDGLEEERLTDRRLGLPA